MARGGLGVELTELEAEVPAMARGRPGSCRLSLARDRDGRSGSVGLDLGPVNAIDGDLKTAWSVGDFGTSTSNPFAAFQFAEPVDHDRDTRPS